MKHTSSASEGVPAAGPTPVPGPQPVPGPFLPPDPYPAQSDWWRCLRLVAVSGRYDGEMTSPNAGKYALELRVDVDVRHANSPVLNRVSGDLHQVQSFNWLGHFYKWRVYSSSWIIDDPVVTWSKCSVEITGNVRFWKGHYLATTARIVISWESGTIGPAEVTFSAQLGSSTKFTCAKKSNAFRDVTLEVDVCKSVNTPPILPSYDTCAHSNHPADLPCRTLTIEEAYAEAGIDLTINPTHDSIDDSLLPDTHWLPSELHDAMETYFSQITGAWPKWQLWGLLASGVFEDPVDGVLPGVAGIMFDTIAAYGGAGEAPERQGCAVFRNHSWFNNVVANPPANDAQAASLRYLLYCYVHEMGHAFNLLHSWDKGRPDALSWMNYDWKYDSRNGAGTFWGNFRFRFDDEELIHMRHGDRASVIMGGDPWSSGMHLEAPVGAMADVQGNAPVELLLRSKGYFQFMEPVIVEFRIRNLTDLSLDLDTRLNPEYGGVIVYVRRPDGRILEYAPILCRFGAPELKVLKSQSQGVEGEDRYSQNVNLSYGTYGYYFDEPGEYLVRAIYQGAGDVLIPSSVHRLRIGRPFAREEERIAQDYFTHDAGMALYLNGSSSLFLKKGMDTLETMADRYQKTPVGAHLSVVLAQNLAQPFVRIENGALLEARAANPSESLALSARAVEQQKRDASTFTNIGYNQLVRTRAKLMVAMGDNTEAKKELGTLAKDLKKRGVNQPVLADIEAYAKSL